jgi:hypothetical protein
MSWVIVKYDRHLFVNYLYYVMTRLNVKVIKILNHSPYTIHNPIPQILLMNICILLISYNHYCVQGFIHDKPSLRRNCL